MGKFQVITNTQGKKDYKPKPEQYLRVTMEYLSQEESATSHDILKKIVFCCVRYISKGILPHYEEQDDEWLHNALRFVFAIAELMAKFTPVEFVQMFPVTKTYDGRKCGKSDYFSTIEQVKQYPQDQPIGDESILEFCDGYNNNDILCFSDVIILLLDEIRKREGKPSLMEDFLLECGIPAYVMYGLENVSVNNQVREVSGISKAKKRSPKYWKVIDGGKLQKE